MTAVCRSPLRAVWLWDSVDSSQTSFPCRRWGLSPHVLGFSPVSAGRAPRGPHTGFVCVSASFPPDAGGFPSCCPRGHLLAGGLPRVRGKATGVTDVRLVSILLTLLLVCYCSFPFILDSVISKSQSLVLRPPEAGLWACSVARRLEGWQPHLTADFNNGSPRGSASVRSPVCHTRTSHAAEPVSALLPQVIPLVDSKRGESQRWWRTLPRGSRLAPWTSLVPGDGGAAPGGPRPGRYVSSPPTRARFYITCSHPHTVVDVF